MNVSSMRFPRDAGSGKTSSRRSVSMQTTRASARFHNKVDHVRRSCLMALLIDAFEIPRAPVKDTTALVTSAASRV